MSSPQSEVTRVERALQRDAASAEFAHLERCHALVRERAAGRVEGVFGPDSAMWLCIREWAIPLMAMRAVMLQIAHPAVAAAGARNSRIMEDFVPRAQRTFASVYVMQFGALDSALAAARRVFALHARVRGRIPQRASAQHAGTPYRANQPALLRWVLATMVDAALMAFGTVLAPLDDARREAFYQDMLLLGLMLGLSEDDMPPDLASFEVFFAETLESDQLRVGPTARQLSEFLFREGWNFAYLDEIWVAGIVPARFRDAYGLSWTPARRAAHRLLRANLRALFARLPTALRFVPAYHRSAMRVAADRGTSAPLASRAHGFASDRLVLPARRVLRRAAARVAISPRGPATPSQR